MDGSNDALAPTRARHKPSNNFRNTKWTADEDNLLLQLRARGSTVNLSEFVHLFPGKTNQQITERWDKVLNPSLVKGSWTREEDEAIIEFVKREGTKNWAQLAARLSGRVGKQCRERWRNHLDPEVNREAWTEQEDQILIELHDRIGNQWVKIAESLPGRSDNAIKNRWNSTLKKRLDEIRTGTPRKRRGRPSRSLVIPRSADDIPKPPKFDELRQSVASPSLPITPGWLSPFGSRSPSIGLKSPFSLFSPQTRDQAFGLETSAFESSERGFGASPGFSPMFFGRSENRTDQVNIFSPTFLK
jgi:hypothetical protein